MSKIRDETIKVRQVELKHNQELVQLRKEQRMKDSQIRCLEADKRQKELILRRRQEEVSFVDAFIMFFCYFYVARCLQSYFKISFAFLPRDALLSAVYAVVVCLSVCVCVCVCVCVRHTPVLYQNG